MNPKQQRFAEEYITDFNGTQAAIRAGYSENGADVQATRLLANASVSNFIKERTQSIAKKLGITAEYVLGGLRDTAEATKPKRHEANPSVAIKSYELLGKHLKLFEEDDKKSSTSFTVNILKF